MQHIKKVDKIKDKVSLKDHGKLVDLIDNSLTAYHIGNDLALKSNTGGEFIDNVLMSDQYFYDHWITQFAIGEVGGRNYFNMQAWSDITEKFTKGVLIVHEDTKQFLFHIPKFIKLQNSEEATFVLNNVCKIANNIKFQNDPAVKEQSINTFSEVVVDIMENDVPVPTLTELVPDEIYKLYDIVPNALKAMIYIRDHYKSISPTDPNFDKATNILKNHFSGRLVSEKDKQFIKSLTNGDFYFEESELQTTETKEEAPVKVEEFNPFAD